MRRIAAIVLLLLSAVTLPTYGQNVIDKDEGVSTIYWSDAADAIGDVAYVCGKVVGVRDIGTITFINFDDNRPPKFTAVVFDDYYGKFPDQIKTLYEGKIVKIRGQITTHRDRPQIVLTSPDQIEVIDALPSKVKPKRRAREATSDQLVIATFNLLNLFDEVDSPYYADETTPAKPREQLESAAKAIRKINADIIAFQEVESRGYLTRFRDAFLRNMGYDHVVHYEGNDLRGIDVCLMSRVPVGPVESHRHVKFSGPDGRQRSMSRDLLSVKLLPPGKSPIEIWVLHLKSNSGGREFAEPVRLAEAQYLRQQLDRRLTTDPDAQILLMGDFNDLWGSPTLETIVGTGATALQLPLSEAAIKSLVTYNREPRRSMIDFILCSPAMAKQYVPGSYRTVPGSVEKTGSDHNPVVAWFELN
ncbi:MAG: endonuclease/exonuclease/phosphatase family protein [Planctomycetota bacterium]